MSYGDEDSYYGGSSGGNRSKSERVQRSLADYIDVPARIAEFREKYPEGSLRPQDPAEPIQILRIKAEHPVKDSHGNVTGSEVREEVFLQYICVARRKPDDPEPGIGIAWEIYPGLTTYTRRSEAMNAETSAWGRAIVATLAADAKQSVATQQEIRNRRAERDQEEESQRPAPDLEQLDNAIGVLFTASDKHEMAEAWRVAGSYWLHDVEIPGRDPGFRYRDMWKERMDQLNAEAAKRAEASQSAGLGEETGEPQVAPDVTGDGMSATDEATAARQIVEDQLDAQQIQESPEVTGDAPVQE